MTRLLTLLLVLMASPVFAQWREGAVVGVPVDHTRTFLWIGTTGALTIPNVAISVNGWTTLDLSDGPHWTLADGRNFAPHLPEDTIAIFVSGIHVITNASGSICTMTSQFRAPGSGMLDGQYRMQAMATPGDGDRENIGMWVPVVNRKTEFYWTYTPVAGCSYAISLEIDAYLRSGAVSVPPPPPSGKWFRVCTDVKTCYEGLLNLVGGL